MKRMRSDLGRSVMSLVVCCLFALVAAGLAVPSASWAATSGAAGTWQVSGAVMNATTPGWLLGDLQIAADGTVAAGTFTRESAALLAVTGGSVTVAPDQAVTGQLTFATCTWDIQGEISDGLDLLVLGYRESCTGASTNGPGTLVAVKRTTTTFTAADLGGSWFLVREILPGTTAGSAGSFVSGTVNLNAGTVVTTGSGGTDSAGGTWSPSGGSLSVGSTGVVQGSLQLTGGGSWFFQGVLDQGKRLMTGIVTVGTSYGIFHAVRRPVTLTQADAVGNWSWLGISNVPPDSTVVGAAGTAGWNLGRFPLDATGALGWNVIQGEAWGAAGLVPGGRLTVSDIGDLTGNPSLVGGGAFALVGALGEGAGLFVGTVKAAVAGQTEPGVLLGLRRSAPTPEACQSRALLLPVDATVNAALAAGDCHARLDVAAFAHWYSFSGSAGERVTFDLTSAEFVPRLTLFGPRGGVVAQGAGTVSAGPGSLRLENISLPETGTYVVEAGGLQAAAIGSYSLTRSGGITGCTATVLPPLPATAAGTLAVGGCSSPYTGGAVAESYTFAGTAGEAVSLTLTAAAPVRPVLLLLTPNGEFASVATGVAGGTAGIVQYSLPVAGTYTVVVTSAGGGEIGSYNLTADSVAASTCAAPTALASGASVSQNLPDTSTCGSYVTGVPAHQYKVTGVAGNLLDADLLQGAGGSARMMLALLAPNGALLALDRDLAESPGAALRYVLLPVTGDYVLEVLATEFGAGNPAAGVPYYLSLKSYVPPSGPVIGTLTPTAAVGVAATITGTNFGSLQGSVLFETAAGGTIAANIVSWTNTAVKLTVPDGAVTGDIVLTRADGVESAPEPFIVPDPILTSLTPASAAAGVTVTLVGNHFGTTEGTVTFTNSAGDPTPAVLVVGSWKNTGAKVIVPADADTGPLTVRTADVPARTASKTFTRPGGPVITALQPNAAAHGIPVTLVGANFGTVPGTVEFATATGTVAATVARWANTSVVVTVPLKAASGDVTLRTAANRPATKPFTVPPPSITSITPSTVSQSPDRNWLVPMTVTGTHFGTTQGAGKVLFTTTGGAGTIEATEYTSWSNTVIKTRVLWGAVSGPVTVKRDDAVTSNGVNFTLDGIGITAITPSSAAPGSTVTISGTMFGATQRAGWVEFPANPGTIRVAAGLVWSNTTIRVKVPTGAASGDVKVINNDLYKNAVGFPFTVLGPTIASLTPAKAPIGATVTIAGTGFRTVAGTVEFAQQGGGTVGAAIQSWSNSSVKVTVPAGAATGDLVLTVFDNPDGQASKPFILATQPIVTSITPATGAPGVPVIIAGSNFGTVAGTVAFAGPADATVTSWTNTSLKLTVPAGAVTGDVTVTRSDGIPGPPKTFTVPDPKIVGLTPLKAAPGATVIITGSAFGTARGGITFAKIGGGTTDGPVTSWTNTIVKVSVPADAETGLLTLSTAGPPVRTATKLYTAAGGATIAGISPLQGASGLPVTITGTGFGAVQGTGTVTFTKDGGGTVAGVVTSWINTAVKLTVPVGAVTGDVALTTAANRTAAKLFTVPSPTISLLTPATASVGATVTVTGTYLGLPRGTVTFAKVGGGTVAGTVVSWTNTIAKVTVPPGAATGSLTLNRADNKSASKTFTAANPTITGLTPATALVGTLVTITGTHLGFLQGSVSFVDKDLNAVPAVVTSWTNTAVKVTVPAGTETGNVTLSTADVPAKTAVKLFTVPGGPIIAGLTPATGVAEIVVTISGSQFGTTQGTGKVTFTRDALGGTVDAAPVVSWSATLIKVKVPLGAITGYVTVWPAAGRPARKLFTVPDPTVKCIIGGVTGPCL
jgi:hypothetical protein